MGGIMACRSCVNEHLKRDKGYKPNYFNVNLGQTVEKWTHVNKQGEEKKHKLTVGKDWEINNRAIAEDGKTVINRVTRKEAQY
jgi:hypothetical protein